MEQQINAENSPDKQQTARRQRHRHHSRRTAIAFGGVCAVLDPLRKWRTGHQTSELGKANAANHTPDPKARGPVLYGVVGADGGLALASVGFTRSSTHSHVVGEELLAH
jgi:hypothetical protein